MIQRFLLNLKEIFAHSLHQDLGIKRSIIPCRLLKKESKIKSSIIMYMVYIYIYLEPEKQPFFNGYLW